MRRAVIANGWSGCQQHRDNGRDILESLNPHRVVSRRQIRPEVPDWLIVNPPVRASNGMVYLQPNK
jgi:hypothetical protein